MIRHVFTRTLQATLLPVLVLGALTLSAAALGTAAAAAQDVEGVCGSVGSVAHNTVDFGDDNEDVRHAQCLLNENFGFSLIEDGIFGENTLIAVESFQSVEGLTVDGVIGPCTWAVLHLVDPPAGC